MSLWKSELPRPDLTVAEQVLSKDLYASDGISMVKDVDYLLESAGMNSERDAYTETRAGRFVSENCCLTTNGAYNEAGGDLNIICLLYTSPSPRDS